LTSLVDFILEATNMTKDEFDAWFAVEDARDPNTTNEWYVVGEVYHGSPLEYLMDFLGLCGCGTGKPKAAIARTLWALWEAHKASEDGVDFPQRTPWFIAGDFYNDPMVELILMIFHDKKIVTHGSSITGAWLEPAGVEWAERVFSPWTPEKD